MIWLDGQPRDHLPIDNKLPDILAYLDKHSVLICEAETGAGKSTRIAQAALLANIHLKIWMTQPRRNACRWVGKRIATELGSKPGQTVGWRLFGEKPIISDATRLHLMIDQSLANRIREEPTLPEGLIIIDEAHERSLPIDLLLALIKEKLPQSPNTRVIVTSATIDTEKFSAFFDGAPILKIQGRCFPVSVNVFPLSHGEHHTEGAIRAAKQVFQQFSQKELFVFDEENNRIIVDKGSVLVLLPGKEDIMVAMRTLNEEVLSNQSTASRIEVLSYHGESALSEQEKVQTVVPQNTLRFVCCTEVLRTSVTIPETIGVIDSLQVKRPITNEHGVVSLEKIAVSKAEANQGKGRAGRTGPGFYIAVSFGNQYDELNPWPTPAILRDSLTSLVLQIASMKRSIRTLPLIDKPATDKVEIAIKRLQVLGALTQEETISDIGKKLLEFPLSPELAMILITANRYHILEEAIIVTAALEVEGFFQPPKKDSIIIADESLLRLILNDDGKGKASPAWAVRNREGNYEVKCSHPDFPYPTGAKWVSDTLRQQWAGKSHSDFTAIVNAYSAIRLEEQQLTARSSTRRMSFKSRQHYLHNWCFARGLNYKKYLNVQEIIVQIQESLRSSPLKLNESALVRKFDENALTKAVLSGKLDHVAQHPQYDTNSFISHLGDFNLDYSSACPADAEFVIAASFHKIHVQGRRGNAPTSKQIASYAAPIEPSWLVEIAPQLCSTISLNDMTYIVYEDVVKETQRHYFNNRQIGEECVTVSPEKACPILAQWLAKQCIGNGSLRTTSNQPLQELIDRNKAINKLAQELNYRVGQTYFKVYGVDELIELWKPLLTGVTGFGQPGTLGPLLLPELDEKLIAQVRRDCPNNIQYLDLTLPIQYQGRAAPKIKINENELRGNWIRFLENPPKLSNSRRVTIEVVRDAQSIITIEWTTESHADLSRINPSSIHFVQERTLNIYLLTIQQSKTVPWFLSEQASQNVLDLNTALNKFMTFHVEPIQLKFIQWCIAMQVVTLAKRENNTILLNTLAAHAFMKKRDYFSYMDTIGSAFGGIFGWLAKRPEAQPNPQNQSTFDVGYFIQDAIRIISITNAHQTRRDAKLM